MVYLGLLSILNSNSSLLGPYWLLLLAATLDLRWPIAGLCLVIVKCLVAKLTAAKLLKHKAAVAIESKSCTWHHPFFHSWDQLTRILPAKPGPNSTLCHFNSKQTPYHRKEKSALKLLRFYVSLGNFHYE